MQDDRAEAARRAGVAWYDATYDRLGLAHEVRDDLWVGLDPAPPYHSGAIALRPGLKAKQVARTVADLPSRGVADPWAALDLTRQGYDLLFAATWLHAPAAEPVTHPSWSRVETRKALREWASRHDYSVVLGDVVLDDPTLTVLARTSADGGLTGGAVLHRVDDGLVGLSNVWGELEDPVDWAVLRGVAATHHPDAALVGYEHGADASDANAAGFAMVGTHAVWVVPG